MELLLSSDIGSSPPSLTPRPELIGPSLSIQKKVDLFSKQLLLVGSLEDGDRLLLYKGRIQGKKLYLAKHRNLLMRLLYLFLQAVHRLVTGQRTEQSIHTVSQLIKTTSAALQEIDWNQINDPTEKVALVNQLKRIEQGLTQQGWDSFYRTSTLNIGSFFPPLRHGYIEQICTDLLQQKKEFLEEIQKLLKTHAFPHSHEENDIVQEFVSSLIHPSTEPVEVSKMIFYSKEQVQKVLTKLYGLTVVEEMWPLYGFHDEKQSFISQLEIQAFLVGVVANLTLEDLQEIVNQKKPSSLFPYSMQEQLAQAKKDNGLSEAKALLLVQQLRSIQIPSAIPSRPLGEHLRSSLFARLFGTLWIDEKNEWIDFDSPLNQAQYLADLGRLVVFERIENYRNHPNKHLKPFREMEQLARDIIYALVPNEKTPFRDNVVIPVYDAQHPREMTLKQARILIGKPGLYGACVFPAFRKEETHLSIDFVFRGTYCGHSLRRDAHLYLHKMGPGYKSFAHYKDDVVQNVQGFLQSFQEEGKKLLIRFSGHSLGAADAQYTVAALLTKLSPSRIELHGFNPPKIDAKTTQSFIENLRHVPKTQVDAYYYKTEGDGVQLAGKTLLGAHEYSKDTGFVDKPKNLTTTVFLFTHPNPEMNHLNLKYRLKAHGAYMMAVEPNQGKTYLKDVFTNNSKLTALKKGSDQMPVSTEEKFAAQSLASNWITRISSDRITRSNHITAEKP